MQMLYIWILAAVVFGVLEGITAQLVSIWFVLGAVAAAVAAACGGAVWLQGVLFVAVSVVALLATKPLVKKYLVLVFRPPTRIAALAEPAWSWKILTI